MKEKLRQLICFLTITVLTSALCIWLNFTDNKYSNDSIQPIDGLLVMDKESLEDITYIIDGWTFYPDRLLTPNDFADGNPEYFSVYTSIGENTRFDNLGTRKKPHGSGTYLLRLRLPKEMATYCLEMPEIYSAYKLYVNERLILQIGEPNQAEYKASTYNCTVTFDAYEKASILIAVSDYSNFYSGMVYPPAFGKPLKINRMREIRLGIALFMALISLGSATISIYFGIKIKHENTIIFSILCLTVFCFVFLRLLHSFVVLPVFPFYAIEMFFRYFLSLPIIVIHNGICGIKSRVRNISVWVSSIFCGFTLFYGLAASYLTSDIMRLFSIAIYFFKIMTAVYFLVTAFFFVRKKSKHANLIYYASIAYAATFIWDRIFPEYEPILTGWFNEWGALALVCAIGCTLWNDIVIGYSRSIILGEENRQMLRQISMHNEYVKQIKKHNEENIKITHDFRQHMRTVSGMVEQAVNENENIKILENLKNYINQIQKNNNNVNKYMPGAFSNNMTVDALLQYYYIISEEHGIKTEIKIVLPEKIPLTDSEICAVLGNLLENAVDACLRTEKCERNIYAVSRVEKSLFLIVENTYDGFSKLESGVFLSRKTGEIRYGVGIQSVKTIVEKYGGRCEIYPQENLFKVGIMLPLN